MTSPSTLPRIKWIRGPHGRFVQVWASPSEIDDPVWDLAPTDEAPGGSDQPDVEFMAVPIPEVEFMAVPIPEVEFMAVPIPEVESSSKLDKFILAVLLAQGEGETKPDTGRR